MMMTARSDLASAVKEALTMDQVARRYGFEPTRAGFIKCPFHKGDHTASLKLYPGQRGFHCFGCRRGGSVIDFVMELYGISFAQAVVRLNADFGLGLVGERPSPTARSKVLEERRKDAQRAQEMRRQYWDMAAAHLFLHEYVRKFSPTLEEWERGGIDPVYAWAVKQLPKIEFEIEEWETGYERERAKRNSV